VAERAPTRIVSRLRARDPLDPLTGSEWFWPIASDRATRRPESLGGSKHSPSNVPPRRASGRYRPKPGDVGKGCGLGRDRPGSRPTDRSDRASRRPR
jgi:hypothetical protein